MHASTVIFMKVLKKGEFGHHHECQSSLNIFAIESNSEFSNIYHQPINASKKVFILPKHLILWF